jgi:DNA-binding MarR family transcriptional regulator
MSPRSEEMTMAHQLNHEETFQLVLSMHRLLRTLRPARQTSGIPATQLLVLVELSRSGPQRIGELAVQVQTSQPTATNVVRWLEQAGLVRREVDPEDGRAIRVDLTDLGSEKLLSVVHNEAELLAERMAELTPAELDLLLGASAVLRRLTEPPTNR